MIGGHVPMFRMKLPLGPILGAIALLVLGGAMYIDAYRDPGNLPAQELANIVLTVCIVLAGMLIIIATARMWYRHLWHDRYKNGKLRK